MFKNRIWILLCCMAIFIAGCGKSEDKMGSNTQGTKKESDAKTILYTDVLEQKKDIEYKTELVKVGKFEDVKFVNATVDYVDTLSVKMEAATAVFTKYTVKVGDKVQEGDVIARYSVDYDEADLEQKISEVERAEENYNNEIKSKKSAINQAEYNISLMPEGSDKEISKVKLEKTKMEYELFTETKEDVEYKRNELNEYKAQLEKTKLLAPASGTILSIEAFEEGDTVMSGAVVAKISNGNKFYLKIPDEGGALRYNMEVSIGIGTSKNDLTSTLKGRVVSATNFLASKKQQKVGYIEVLDPTEGVNWDSNIFVEYSIMSIDNVILLNKDAVKVDEQQDNAPYVLLLEDGAIHKRFFVSFNSNTEYYWVLQGLEEGQSVILE